MNFEYYKRRIFAFFIDWFIITLMVCFTIVSIEYILQQDLIECGFPLTFSIIVFLYFTIQYSKNGQSIGKRIMKIKIVKVNMDFPIDLKTVLIRQVCFFLFFGLGTFVTNAESFNLNYFFLILLQIFAIVDTLLIVFNSAHRSLHDIIAGTVVISVNS